MVKLKKELIDEKIFKITFVPRSNSLKTEFSVIYKDMPELIHLLIHAYNEREKTFANE